MSFLIPVFIGSLCAWAFYAIFSERTSPLSLVPNAHFSAPYSRLWLLWIRAAGKEFSSLHTAHLRMGPVLRISPTDISINCIENGVQIVYGGNWDKGKMYRNFMNYGHPPLFAIQERKQHAERKKIYRPVYTKSMLQNSPNLQEVFLTVGDKLKRRLYMWARTGEIVNMFPFAASYVMDIITAYIYGQENGTNWIEDEDAANQFLPSFTAVFGPSAFFITAELPGVVDLMGRVGLSPLGSNVLAAFENVMSFLPGLTRNLELTHETNHNKAASPPAIYHIRKKLGESNVPADRRDDLLASDLLDQVHAAHEVTGIALTYLMWELSKNPNIQKRLREELRGLRASNQAPNESKLLEAVLMETMRLHPAAFGPFPRVAPAGARLGGYDIPAGTVVTASPYTLGRNPDVFAQPDLWLPQRWINAGEAESKEMKKWVWMFNSGARVCLGEHLARMAMRSFIIDIYSDFRTEIGRESNMNQLETFVSLPADESLYLCVYTL